MKLPSVYLKMRVLGAIDTVAGRTRHERVHAVAAMTFTTRTRSKSSVTPSESSSKAPPSLVNAGSSNRPSLSTMPASR